MKKTGAVLALCLVLGLAGCTAKAKEPRKLRDLEFTVVTPENLPQELQEMIEEKKVEPFKLTYEDEGWMYAAVGYGAQKDGGYSIQVNAFYETSNAIYVDTNLLGPQDTDSTGGAGSYPYIVLKTEQIDKNVVFQ